VTPREWLSSVFFSHNYIVMPPDTEVHRTLPVARRRGTLLPDLAFHASESLGSLRARRYLPAIAIAVAIWRVVDCHWFHIQLWPGVLSNHPYERTDTRFDGLL